MEDLQQRIMQLHQSLMIDEHKHQIIELEQQLERGGVWDNPEEGSRIAQELTRRKNIVTEWQHVADLIAAASPEDREFLELELHHLELATFLSKPHDALPAIMAIHAGTGGVEAQDWASMLSRMYMRYAEKQGWHVTVVEKNDGEEAGIKSITVRLNGENAYGYLRGEAGVHRLVRLSPFNAQHLRQTSFALVEVIPEIAKKQLEIPDKDLRIDVYRASGKGGQGVNTTDSAVRITHIPTNIVVTCQNERSQLQNKETAMRILESRLITLMEKTNAVELSQLKPQVLGSWGNQIRNYVMQPYTLVKDTRTNVETADVLGVLNGDLDIFIQAEVRLA